MRQHSALPPPPSRQAAEGWRLNQPEPGILIWRTPAGRIYTTSPIEYPL
jgi:hypothetical protein